jgi:hypothetical protein
MPQDTQINVPDGPEQVTNKPRSKAEVAQKIVDHYNNMATEDIEGASRSIQKLEQSIA